MTRHLITTAIQSTWPDKSCPVKFLGEWCLLYSEQKNYESLDYETYEYHWNDRQKLKNDYKKLSSYYESELILVAEMLNKKHGVDYSVKYWRILVGPWLGYFTNILFDRWSMLKVAVESGEVVSVSVIDRESNDLIPQDMEDFNSLRTSDNWNEMIFGEILNISFKDKINIKIILPASPEFREFSFLQKNIGWIKDIMDRLISILIRPLVHREEHFFKSTTFSWSMLCKIQIKLGIVPKLWRSKKIPRIGQNCIDRSFCSLIEKDSFEEILHAMVFRHMPSVYLEGYESLRSRVSKLPWPSNPKTIFTHTAYEQDDLFKQWAGEKTEAGSKLVLGQHGGHYGIGLLSFPQDHETAISDSYLTWGWDDPAFGNIRKSVFQRPFSRNLKHEPNGNLLIVMYAMPRYMHLLFSAALSSQWLDYFDDQLELIASLPDIIRSHSIVRISLNDYGWRVNDRLQASFNNLKIDNGVKDIQKQIENCRLYVATYNATTFLETLSYNIPTVIFWDPERWELKEDVIPFFKQLREVGIFHESPQSASSKICEVWNNVDDWWYSDKVQTARVNFCSRFARSPKDLAEEIYINLIQASKNDQTI